LGVAVVAFDGHCLKAYPFCGWFHLFLWHSVAQDVLHLVCYIFHQAFIWLLQNMLEIPWYHFMYVHPSDASAMCQTTSVPSSPSGRYKLVRLDCTAICILVLLGHCLDWLGFGHLISLLLAWNSGCNQRGWAEMILPNSSNLWTYLFDLVRVRCACIHPRGVVTRIGQK